MTPAFRNSPRSTRGTTRTTAYWNWLRCRAGTLSLRDETGPITEPGHEVIDVRPALGARSADERISRQPNLGFGRHEAFEQAARDEAGEARVRRLDGARERQQHVLGGPLERPPGVLCWIAPRVMDVERGAVVDEPRPAVPDEHVGIFRRAVRVGDKGVEPDDVSGPVRIRHDVRGRVERQRAGQEVEPDVLPDARDDQVLDLIV